jgi:NAD(P)-dependent dehydrogenase (short-subunit alcohol dehydrogenase family)
MPGRNAASLEATVAAGHAQGNAVVDVTDEAALAGVLRQVAVESGPVDILVANAGAADAAPFAKTSADQFRRLFELNVLGIVHATRAVLGDMVARRFGRIVAVASTAGLKGYAYVSAYCAAKHAAVGLVRALALETATTGVTVNAVCPSFADTDLTRESLDRISAKTGRSREDALAALVAQIPLRRLIKPEEVATAVLFLCSGEAQAITGTTLAVAGGEV